MKARRVMENLVSMRSFLIATVLNPFVAYWYTLNKPFVDCISVCCPVGVADDKVVSVISQFNSEKISAVINY
jgi:hypothetical protein